MANWWETLFGSDSAQDVTDQYSQYGAGKAGVNLDAQTPIADSTPIDWESIRESIGDAFGGSKSTSVIDGSFAPTNTQTQDVATKTGDDKNDEGIIGKITGFANKNKSLTEMLLKGVAGGIAADQAQSNATRQLRERDAIQQEADARLNASITGLRKPGIIAQQSALRRIDGTNVFNNGRISRG